MGCPFISLRSLNSISPINRLAFSFFPFACAHTHTDLHALQEEKRRQAERLRNIPEEIKKLQQEYLNLTLRGPDTIEQLYKIELNLTGNLVLRSWT